MLSYDQFKEEFNERFPSFMGAGYKDYYVRSHHVIKRGVERDAFVFVSKEEDKNLNKCLPTLYYDEIYSSYINDGDMDRELSSVAYSMQCAYSNRESMTDCCNLEHLKSNVIAELVSSTYAKKYYTNYPQRSFLDVTIIYRWVVRIDDTGVYCGVIDNELMKAVGLDEEGLYEIAIKKTKKLLGYKTISFDKVIRDMMKREGVDSKTIKSIIESIKDDKKSLIITNKHQFRASTALLYKDYLSKLVEKINSGFYIIPVSVNELLVISDANASTSKLLKVHRDVNVEHFDSDYEFLSNNIYYFSKDVNQLVIIDKDDSGDYEAE
ncbi:MAG: DUF5688 family protein [Saccharofermentans sp.]|nr:DUF5688 family protein [Saccharofermentans sp.]